MGIDHVEREAAFEPQKRRQTAHREKEAIEPLERSRHRKKPWTPHLDAFLRFHRTHARPEMRLEAPHEPLDWKPRDRSDNGYRNQPRDPEHALANEQARRRLPGMRKQRRENHNPRVRLGHKRHPPRP